jgi:hypothetical protein
MPRSHTIVSGRGVMPCAAAETGVTSTRSRACRVGQLAVI